MPVLEWRSTYPVSADELYVWHTRPGAFARSAPPWQRIRVLERSGGIDDDGRVVLSLEFGLPRGLPGDRLVRLRWEVRHHDHVPGRQFVDTQVKGPFAFWEHAHRFVPKGEHESVLEDHLEYRLPTGAAATLFADGPVRRQLERVFRFRHERLRHDLERHSAFADAPRLTVAVSGAGGLVGANLTAFLTTGGHQVRRLVRRSPSAADEIFWDPDTGAIDAAALEGLDAVVHLAGESLFGVWTAGKRERIMRSRERGTALLSRTLARLQKPPRALLSTSAVGIYGDRGDEILTEQSAPGEGFLADVCKAWEAALEPAREAGIRVAVLRLAVLMSPSGGALPLMMTPFRLGAGGRIGSGEQWMSWVAPDDVLGAALRLLTDYTLTGPFNMGAPDPVTNAEFTHTLARVLRRPAVVAVPGAVMERALGEMGRSLVLTSERMVPKRLEQAGFRFLFPRLEDALRFELGHPDIGGSDIGGSSVGR